MGSPTLVNVGAARLLTDGVELSLPDQGLEIAIILRCIDANLEPIRFFRHVVETYCELV